MCHNVIGSFFRFATAISCLKGAFYETKGRSTFSIVEKLPSLIKLIGYISNWSVVIPKHSAKQCRRKNTKKLSAPPKTNLLTGDHEKKSDRKNVSVLFL